MQTITQENKPFTSIHPNRFNGFHTMSYDSFKMLKALYKKAWEVWFEFNKIGRNCRKQKQNRQEIKRKFGDKHIKSCRVHCWEQSVEMLQPCKRKDGGHDLNTVTKEFVDAETGKALILSREHEMRMIVEAFWQAKKRFDSVEDVEKPILSDEELNRLYKEWMV